VEGFVKKYSPMGTLANSISVKRRRLYMVLVVGTTLNRDTKGLTG
jgi:hypothetical protein